MKLWVCSKSHQLKLYVFFAVWMNKRQKKIQAKHNKSFPFINSTGNSNNKAVYLLWWKNSFTSAGFQPGYRLLWLQEMQQNITSVLYKEHLLQFSLALSLALWLQDQPVCKNWYMVVNLGKKENHIQTHTVYCEFSSSTACLRLPKEMLHFLGICAGLCSALHGIHSWPGSRLWVSLA